MKNYSLTLKLFGKLCLAATFLLFNSCSDEELDTSVEQSGTEDLISVQKATPVDGKTYLIRNVNSGKYLDVSGRSNKNGANIQQWKKTGDTNQQWEIDDTSNGFVRLKGVDSGKSLEISAGSNSNGANAQQWEYRGHTHQQWEIISVGNGNFRLKSRDSGKSLEVRNNSTANGGNVAQWKYVGSNSQKWFFEEVGSSGGGGNPGNGGGSGSAAAIIGGMGSKWKLNGFSGSLNIGSGSYGKSGANGLTYKDRASTSDNNNWFFDINGYAAFKCHVGNPSSNNSGNMRSELRELDGSGDEIEWNGTTGTNHRMRYKVNIRRMPTSGKLCFGQIHGSGSFDDVIRVQIDDSNANRGSTSGKTSGTYDLVIKGYVTEELDRDNRNKSWARIQMKKEYDIEIAMKNKKVTVKLDGKTVYTSKSVNSKDNYFKAGAYLQSAQSDKSPQLKRNKNNFGEVWIKNMQINH